jgi:hypothetical protein
VQATSGDADSIDVAADAFIPVDCTAAGFPAMPPPPVQDLIGEVSTDPWMTEDGLEIYYVKAETSPATIFRASRSSVGAAFVVDANRASFNRINANLDPSMTLDGTMLVFLAGTSPFYPYYVKRTVGGSWSASEPLLGVDSTAMSAAQISWDGLTIYFTSPPGNHLWEATRTSRMSAFGAPRELTSSAVIAPTVSADGLELFATNTGIWRATRASTAATFPALTQALTYGVSPQLSASSRRLVVAEPLDYTIRIAERSCP